MLRAAWSAVDGGMRPRCSVALHVVGFVCAQVVPHITDAIQQWIKSTAKLPVDSLDQEVRPRLSRDWAHPCHIRTGTDWAVPIWLMARQWYVARCMSLARSGSHGACRTACCCLLRCMVHKPRRLSVIFGHVACRVLHAVMPHARKRLRISRAGMLQAAWSPQSAPILRSTSLPSNRRRSPRLDCATPPRRFASARPYAPHPPFPREMPAVLPPPCELLFLALMPCGVVHVANKRTVPEYGPSGQKAN